MSPAAVPASKTFQKAKPGQLQWEVLILFGLWVLAAIADGTWLWLDQSPPHWDEGDHLSRALNHWQVLQSPSWFSGDWWHNLWQQAPTQRAPLVYLLTVPFLALFGISDDVAMKVNLFFSAVLVSSVYLMGRRLFGSKVGLWAAGLSLLAPTLGYWRLHYLLDYGLTAVTAFTAMGLTYWWTAHTRRSQWWFTLIWALGMGAMLLTRTSSLLFLVGTVGWLALLTLLSRQWLRLFQMVFGSAVALVFIWPWFSTNWLTIISTTFTGLAYGVTYRSDPQANSLAGWLYYPSKLPEMVSSPVLFLALAAGVFALIGGLLSVPRLRPHPTDHLLTAPSAAWLWLGGSILMILSLGAVGSSKEPRFLMPLIPLLSVALARMLWWRRDRPWQALRWLAALGSALLLLGAMFPLPGAALIRPNSWHPYTGATWPNAEIVAAIAEKTPHLTANLGMVTNTAQLNPFNMDFYGDAADFQVAARQLSFSPDTALQDAQALDWYLTKTGDQGAYGSIEAGQAALKEAIWASPDLTVLAAWPLPDGSKAQLHHRYNPQVAVEPLNQTAERIVMTAVEAPGQVIAGQVAPITYRIVGPWQDLRQGLLLLTWRSDSDVKPPQWIGDHGIGLGRLYGEANPTTSFSVVERLALTPPKDLTPGTYRLEGRFVDRVTDRHYTVAVPPTAVEVHPADANTATEALPSAPPLDLVTLLRQLSQGLAMGEVDPIFTAVGRINQYDPRQDYLEQTEQAMEVRLQDYPDNLEWLYSKTMAQVLQQDAPAAIATLTRITEVAPHNPYHWAYLGFVHLYAWQPRQAQAALDQAAALDPDLPDLPLLQAAAAIMQLQIPQGIALLQEAGVL
jgi:4-amino-4-deoxy-L-arabinose transferase-like glycosyltransferase